MKDEYTALIESWLAGMNQNSHRKTYPLPLCQPQIQEVSYGMAMEMG
jgi:hypothetical protein